MKIADLKKKWGSEADKLIYFLDMQPHDEVFTTSEIRERLQCSFGSGAFAAQRSRWGDYTMKVTIGNKISSVWGNKQAIAALKKELE